MGSAALGNAGRPGVAAEICASIGGDTGEGEELVYAADGGILVCSDDDA